MILTSEDNDGATDFTTIEPSTTEISEETTEETSTDAETTTLLSDEEEVTTESSAVYLVNGKVPENLMPVLVDPSMLKNIKYSWPVNNMSPGSYVLPQNMYLQPLQYLPMVGDSKSALSKGENVNSKKIQQNVIQSYAPYPFVHQFQNLPQNMPAAGNIIPIQNIQYLPHPIRNGFEGNQKFQFSKDIAPEKTEKQTYKYVITNYNTIPGNMHQDVKQQASFQHLAPLVYSIPGNPAQNMNVAPLHIKTIQTNYKTHTEEEPKIIQNGILYTGGRIPVNLLQSHTSQNVGPTVIKSTYITKQDEHNAKNVSENRTFTFHSNITNVPVNNTIKILKQQYSQHIIEPAITKTEDGTKLQSQSSHIILPYAPIPLKQLNMPPYTVIHPHSTQYLTYAKDIDGMLKPPEEIFAKNIQSEGKNSTTTVIENVMQPIIVSSEMKTIINAEKGSSEQKTKEAITAASHTQVEKELREGLTHTSGAIKLETLPTLGDTKTVSKSEISEMKTEVHHSPVVVSQHHNIIFPESTVGKVTKISFAKGGKDYSAHNFTHGISSESLTLQKPVVKVPSVQEAVYEIHHSKTKIPVGYMNTKVDELTQNNLVQNIHLGEEYNEEFQENLKQDTPQDTNKIHLLFPSSSNIGHKTEYNVTKVVEMGPAHHQSKTIVEETHYKTGSPTANIALDPQTLEQNGYEYIQGNLSMPVNNVVVFTNQTMINQSRTLETEFIDTYNEPRHENYVMFHDSEFAYLCTIETDTIKKERKESGTFVTSHVKNVKTTFGGNIPELNATEEELGVLEKQVFLLPDNSTKIVTSKIITDSPGLEVRENVVKICKPYNPNEREINKLFNLTDGFKTGIPTTIIALGSQTLMQNGHGYIKGNLSMPVNNVVDFTNQTMINQNRTLEREFIDTYNEPRHENYFTFYDSEFVYLCTIETDTIKKERKESGTFVTSHVKNVKTTFGGNIPELNATEEELGVLEKQVFLLPDNSTKIVTSKIITDSPGLEVRENVVKICKPYNQNEREINKLFNLTDGFKTGIPTTIIALGSQTLMQNGHGYIKGNLSMPVNNVVDFTNQTMINQNRTLATEFIDTYNEPRHENYVTFYDSEFVYLCTIETDTIKKERKESGTFVTSHVKNVKTTFGGNIPELNATEKELGVLEKQVFLLSDNSTKIVTSKIITDSPGLEVRENVVKICKPHNQDETEINKLVNLTDGFKTGIPTTSIALGSQTLMQNGHGHIKGNLSMPVNIVVDFTNQTMINQNRTLATEFIDTYNEPRHENYVTFYNSEFVYLCTVETDTIKKERKESGTFVTSHVKNVKTTFGGNIPELNATEKELGVLEKQVFLLPDNSTKIVTSKIITDSPGLEVRENVVKICKPHNQDETEINKLVNLTDGFKTGIPTTSIALGSQTLEQNGHGHIKGNLSMPVNNVVVFTNQTMINQSRTLETEFIDTYNEPRHENYVKFHDSEFVYLCTIETDTIKKERKESGTFVTSHVKNVKTTFGDNIPELNATEEELGVLEKQVFLLPDNSTKIVTSKIITDSPGLEVRENAVKICKTHNQDEREINKLFNLTDRDTKRKEIILEVLHSDVDSIEQDIGYSNESDVFIDDTEESSLDDETSVNENERFTESNDTFIEELNNEKLIQDYKLTSEATEEEYQNTHYFDINKDIEHAKDFETVNIEKDNKRNVTSILADEIMPTEELGTTEKVLMKEHEHIHKEKLRETMENEVRSNEHNFFEKAVTEEEKESETAHVNENIEALSEETRNFDEKLDLEENLLNQKNDTEHMPLHESIFSPQDKTIKSTVAPFLIENSDENNSIVLENQEFFDEERHKYHNVVKVEPTDTTAFVDDLFGQSNVSSETEGNIQDTDNDNIKGSDSSSDLIINTQLPMTYNSSTVNPVNFYENIDSLEAIGDLSSKEQNTSESHVSHKPPVLSNNYLSSTTTFYTVAPFDNEKDSDRNLHNGSNEESEIVKDFEIGEELTHPNISKVSDDVTTTWLKETPDTDYRVSMTYTNDYPITETAENFPMESTEDPIHTQWRKGRRERKYPKRNHTNEGALLSECVTETGVTSNMLKEDCFTNGENGESIENDYGSETTEKPSIDFNKETTNNDVVEPRDMSIEGHETIAPFQTYTQPQLTGSEISNEEEMTYFTETNKNSLFSKDVTTYADASPDKISVSEITTPFPESPAMTSTHLGESYSKSKMEHATDRPPDEYPIPTERNKLSHIHPDDISNDRDISDVTFTDSSITDEFAHSKLTTGHRYESTTPYTSKEDDSVSIEENQHISSVTNAIDSEIWLIKQIDENVDVTSPQSKYNLSNYSTEKVVSDIYSRHEDSTETIASTTTSAYSTHETTQSETSESEQNQPRLLVTNDREKEIWLIKPIDEEVDFKDYHYINTVTDINTDKDKSDINSSHQDLSSEGTGRDTTVNSHEGDTHDTTHSVTYAVEADTSSEDNQSQLVTNNFEDRIGYVNETDKYRKNMETSTYIANTERELIIPLRVSDSQINVTESTEIDSKSDEIYIGMEESNVKSSEESDFYRSAEDLPAVELFENGYVLSLSDTTENQRVSQTDGVVENNKTLPIDDMNIFTPETNLENSSVSKPFQSSKENTNQDLRTEATLSPESEIVANDTMKTSEEKENELTFTTPYIRLETTQSEEDETNELGSVAPSVPTEDSVLKEKSQKNKILCEMNEENEEICKEPEMTTGVTDIPTRNIVASDQFVAASENPIDGDSILGENRATKKIPGDDVNTTQNPELITSDTETSDEKGTTGSVIELEYPERHAMITEKVDPPRLNDQSTDLLNGESKSLESKNTLCEPEAYDDESDTYDDDSETYDAEEIDKKNPRTNEETPHIPSTTIVENTNDFSGENENTAELAKHVKGYTVERASVSKDSSNRNHKNSELDHIYSELKSSPCLKLFLKTLAYVCQASYKCAKLFLGKNVSEMNFKELAHIDEISSSIGKQKGNILIQGSAVKNSFSLENFPIWYSKYSTIKHHKVELMKPERGSFSDSHGLQKQESRGYLHDLFGNRKSVGSHNQKFERLLDNMKNLYGYIRNKDNINLLLKILNMYQINIPERRLSLLVEVINKLLAEGYSAQSIAKDVKEMFYVLKKGLQEKRKECITHNESPCDREISSEGINSEANLNHHFVNDFRKSTLQLRGGETVSRKRKMFHPFQIFSRTPKGESHITFDEAPYARPNNMDRFSNMKIHIGDNHINFPISSADSRSRQDSDTQKLIRKIDSLLDQKRSSAIISKGNIDNDDDSITLYLPSLRKQTSDQYIINRYKTPVRSKLKQNYVVLQTDTKKPRMIRKWPYQGTITDGNNFFNE